MKRGLAAGILAAAVAAGVLAARGTHPQTPKAQPIQASLPPHSRQQSKTLRTSLGFDRNDYPGDSALAALHREFSFAGYWLNGPPGEATSSWLGRRALLQAKGFGFLVLFNGRLDKELKSPAAAGGLGKKDGANAARIALREGFPKGAVIFLDQEEGGRLLPEQNAYLFAWFDAVIAEGFRAGVYCSGMAAPDGPGHFVVTAEDIEQHAGKRNLAFFVYNDACPPSPGCARSANPPAPASSGVALASIWQFAQSPRRAQFGQACSSTYARNGNCYPRPGADGLFLDLDSALSPDPSNGRATGT